VPLNPIAPLLTSWQTRVAQAGQAGIPVSALAPVFQEDLKRVQAGGSPFTNDQAALAVLSNYSQTPALHPVSQKPNWNPMGLLGRAVSDVGTIGKGIITLPKTIAHDVTHIGEMPGQIAKGATDIGHGHVGQGLQEIANAPGLNEALLAASFLIPGGEAATAGLKAGVEKAFAGTLAGGVAGQAMTPEGRKQIAQHPLVAALNILPAAGEVGLGSKIGQAVEHTPLQQHVVKVKLATDKMMQSLGVPQDWREHVWRPLSDARAKAAAGTEAFWKQATEMFGKVDEATMTEMTHALQSGDPAVIDAMEAKVPGFAKMRADYEAFQQAASDTGPMVKLPMPDTGTLETFPVGSLPEKTWNTLTRRKDQATMADQLVKDRTVKVAGIEGQLSDLKVPSVQSITDRLRNEIDSDIAARGAGSKPNPHLAPAFEAIQNHEWLKASNALHRAGLHELANEVQGMGPAIVRQAKLAQSLTDAKASLDTARSGHATAISRLGRQEKAFAKAIEMRPPARWVPNVTTEFHQLAEKWAHDFYSGDPARIDQAVGEVNARYYGGTFEDGKPIFPLAELRKIQRDAVAKITEWDKAGWKPSYVHSVTESQARRMAYPQVGRNQPKITQFRERIVGAGPESLDNVAVALTHQQSELLVNQLWHDAWHGYQAPDGYRPGILDHYGKTHADAVAELRKRGLAAPDAVREVNNEMVNASRFGTPTGRSLFAKGDNLLIPRRLAENLDKLTPSLEDPTRIHAAFDKATRGYRFAVTGLSPQHMVHVIASGAVMFGMAMQDLPSVLRSVGEARQMLKESKGLIEEGAAGGRVMTRFVNQGSQLSDEVALTFATGDRSAARLYADHISKAAHPLQRLNEAVQHFDDHVTQWYKTLDYVSQTKRGLNPEEALYQVSRHFADHAGRSPFERALFKSYVPFGSWSQHLISYMLKFPADHPLRAAGLANLATAEFADNNSGLPRDFAQLFFRGHQAFDIRSFNPFRDIGRTLTLAGFISSLNPAAEAVFKTKGYDPIANSAELYPELQIDPNTGKLVTKGYNFLRVLGESAIPQVQGIEALLGWSDQMRQLKKNDPSAYASTLARYLHFPWLPRNVDIGQARTRDQLNELRLAQAAVSKAMKTGDFSGIDSFNVLPFQGKLVPPATIKALYAMARKVNPSFPASTVLR
jgi:hypothetical protein